MDKKKAFIVGNWKMHGDAAMAQALVKAVAAQAAKSSAEVVICPPATLIHEVAGNAGIKIGGQDCATEAEGAFTGDISAMMLKAAGCSYVIVGHSERRAGHSENNEMVRKKAAAAMAAGLVPIICIGETLAEREAGQAEAVVGRQLAESIPNPLPPCGGGLGRGGSREDAVPRNHPPSQPSPARGEGEMPLFLLAYEPVWAIGTGKNASMDDIRAMHHYIMQAASKRTGLAQTQLFVLYGGSVKAANAREILSTEGVAGVLVGGASLKAEEFCKIIVASGE